MRALLAQVTGVDSQEPGQVSGSTISPENVIRSAIDIFIGAIETGKIPHPYENQRGIGQREVTLIFLETALIVNGPEQCQNRRACASAGFPMIGNLKSRKLVSAQIVFGTLAGSEGLKEALRVVAHEFRHLNRNQLELDGYPAEDREKDSIDYADDVIDILYGTGE